MNNETKNQKPPFSFQDLVFAFTNVARDDHPARKTGPQIRTSVALRKRKKK